MYRTILVPLDGSLFGEHALPLALAIAQQAGASLQIVRVHRPIEAGCDAGPAPSDVLRDAAVREEERAYLDRVVQRLEGLIPPGQVTSALMDGAVAHALREQALAESADLIVMSTHGRGPLSRLWLGSVADHLIRCAPVPVLLVRPREEAPQLTSLPAVRHILVPLDGSDWSAQALGPAVELGSLFQADFLLVQAIEPVIVADHRLGGNAVGSFDEALLRQLETDAQAYLEGLAAPLRAQSLRVQTRVLSNRTAAAAIVDTARTHPASLVALATHGRGGLTRLLLGSVADKIVRAAPTPVLVYRPQHN